MTILNGFSPLAWLDAVVLWFCTWPHWLEYALVGWVIYGTMLRKRKVNAQNYVGVFLTTLTLWPIALGLQILEWLIFAADWVFKDESGPLSALIATFRGTFRWPMKRRDSSLTITEERRI